MKLNRIVPVFALAMLFAQSAMAASIFGISSRAPSAAELGNDPALAGKTVYTATITTDADILQFDSLQLPPALYNNAFGTDSEAPNPAFVAVFPALGADSYVTTPGATSIAGPGFADGGASAWFDTSDDGPKNTFVFAQLTSSATTAEFLFAGKVQLRGAQGPAIEEFRLSFIPEPTSAILLGTCLIGLVAIRRRAA